MYNRNLCYIFAYNLKTCNNNNLQFATKCVSFFYFRFIIFNILHYNFLMILQKYREYFYAYIFIAFSVSFYIINRKMLLKKIYSIILIIFSLCVYILYTVFQIKIKKKTYFLIRPHYTKGKDFIIFYIVCRNTFNFFIAQSDTSCF